MLLFPSQGRNPFFLEPSVIITITDGNKLTHSSGVPDEVRAQAHAVVLLCTVCSNVICLDCVMTSMVSSVFTYKLLSHRPFFFLYPVCCVAAPASELSTGGQ